MTHDKSLPVLREILHIPKSVFSHYHPSMSLNLELDGAQQAVLRHLTLTWTETFCTVSRKGVKEAFNLAYIWGLSHLWNRQQGEPLPCSTPSSVNDSYSACAVVYSFPAVKGCPLKVPFVHRLHFVIKMALFFFSFVFFLESAWGSRLPLSAVRRQKVITHSAIRGTSFLRLRKWIPSIVPSLLSSLPFQSYIYIYTYI